MEPTKLRVLFEYRNGNGNLLDIQPKFGVQVACKGREDIGAIKAAILLALKEKGVKGIEFKDERPHHD